MKKKFFFCAFLLFGQNFLLAGQQKIVFKTGRIATLKVSDVHLFLAGSFNNWNPGDKAWELLPVQPGSYELLKDMPKGLFNFKITRGSWQTVECNSQGKPIDNRSLTILHDTLVTMDIAGWQDNYAAAEKKHTASPRVHIVSNAFKIPQLGRERRIWIYLPADYQSLKKRYPVIYMQDGQNLFDEYTSGFGEWDVDEILDKLQEPKESIIVGIDHGGDYRLTEYDPYDSKYGKGRGDDYVDFLVKTLKPYMDAHYRTSRDARHTTIAGSSMGGLISMYAILKYPGVFGNAGIFSPSFWIAPEIFRFAAKKRMPGSNRLYFVCGDSEDNKMVIDMKKMADVIKTKGTNRKSLSVTVIKGAGHNEKQWNGDFQGFYRWLMGGEVGKSESQ